MMSAPKKTAVAALALVGAVLVSGLTSTAMAEMGQGGHEGMGGHEGRGEMMLEMFQTIDADSDGKVTEAELAAHRAAMFTAADTNSDGMLSADELSAQHMARMAETMADRSARMIERMDNNGDGSLSADEMGEGPMEDHFARIDTDNDGTISQAEVEHAANQMAEHRGKRKHGNMGGWFN